MKKFCLILITVMLLTFSACSSEQRIGYQNLSDNLREYSENYAFEYTDMFILEHTYQTYLSLSSENDVLLSMNLDEKGNIDGLTVTAHKNKINTNAEKEALQNFLSAIIDCYTDLSAKEYKELREKLSYNNTNEYFSNFYERYSSKRNHFVFSSNSEFVFFDCEYYEAIETTSDEK